MSSKRKNENLYSKFGTLMHFSRVGEPVQEGMERDSTAGAIDAEHLVLSVI